MSRHTAPRRKRRHPYRWARRRARFRKVLQLLHRELCQRVKLERRVDGEDAVHQRRLAGGNVVFPGLLLPRRVLRQRLRQDGGLCFAGLQHTVHGAGQLTLELFRTSGILVLHRDHDGGGNAVEVAVPHQAAHNGVYRHVQLRTLQVCTVAHIRKDGLRILVERCADQHLFALADLQLDAGVYVQRHHGRYRVCLLIEYPSAAQQYQRKACRRQRRPPFFVVFFVVMGITVPFRSSQRERTPFTSFGAVFSTAEARRCSIFHWSSGVISFQTASHLLQCSVIFRQDGRKRQLQQRRDLPVLHTRDRVEQHDAPLLLAKACQCALQQRALVGVQSALPRGMASHSSSLRAAWRSSRRRRIRHRLRHTASSQPMGEPVGRYCAAQSHTCT